MKFKSLLITIISLITFVGCGEEPEAPTPTLSQDETNLRQNNNDNNQTDLTKQNLKNNIMTIGESNLTSLDGSTVEKNHETEDKAPLLIGEDIAYINTQFQSIYFDFDRYSIKESMLVALEKNLKLINSPKVVGKNVVVEGNCDEWGTDEYNYALGLKRAQVVKEALVADGVNEDRIKVISYGESNPVCLEQQDDCWAKNRRVDFRLEE